MSLDSDAIVSAMHADANPWAWPIELLRSHDETGMLAASYNESGLEEVVRVAVEEFNASRTAPINATIAFDENINAFAVVPEVEGTMLDVQAVIDAVDHAVVSLDESVRLTSDELQQPTVFSDDERLDAAIEQANKMITADLTLTLAGDVAGEVNAALISQWVVLGEDLSATLDEGQLTAWVDELATACNTVGTTRTYTRADGKQVTVSGGVYGWEVDRDALLTQVKDAVAAGTVATPGNLLPLKRHRVQRCGRARLGQPLHRHRPVRAACALLRRQRCAGVGIRLHFRHSGWLARHVGGRVLAQR